MSHERFRLTRMLFLALIAQALALGGGEVFAQGDAEPVRAFTLFEEVEVPQNRAGGVQTTGTPATRQSRTQAGAPIFTLVGTSRIGDRQTAIVRHMSGSELAVRLNGAATLIPDHEQYSLVALGTGEVGIRYPATVPCAEFVDRGVRCEGNVARLSLTNAEPVMAAAADPASDAESEQATQGEADNASRAQPSRNPFEIIRERARAGRLNQGGDAPTTFQPRRIDPAEVPPGYRVVSTPFGDRIIEDN